MVMQHTHISLREVQKGESFVAIMLSFQKKEFFLDTRYSFKGHLICHKKAGFLIKTPRKKLSIFSCLFTIDKSIGYLVTTPKKAILNFLPVRLHKK